MLIFSLLLVIWLEKNARIFENFLYFFIQMAINVAVVPKNKM